MLSDKVRSDRIVSVDKEIELPTTEGPDRKKISKRRKSRKESKDSAISDVGSKHGVSRETSLDSAAEAEEDVITESVRADEKKVSSEESNNSRRRSSSKLRRRDSGSVIPLSGNTAHGNTLASPRVDSRYLSSPIASDMSDTSPSTPRRSKSPELSKALRTRQEHNQRELAIAETRAKLKQHYAEDKHTHAKDSDIRRTRISKKVLERAKSLEISKLRHTDKTHLLSSKPSSQSLGAVKTTEESYSKHRYRSKSEKRYVVSLGADSTKLGHGKKLLDLSDTSSLTKISERGPPLRSRETGIKNYVANVEPDVTSLETARTSAVYVSVSDSISSTSALPVVHERHEPTNQDGDGASMRSTSNRNHNQRRNNNDDSYTILRAANDTNTMPEINQSKTANSLDPSKAREASIDVTPDMLAREIEQTTYTTLSSILRDELPPIPSTEDSQEASVLDWRPVFKAEMLRLRKEVNDFRQFCVKQVEQIALVLQNSWNKHSELSIHQSKNGLHPVTAPKLSQQLQDVDISLQLLQRKQNIVDLDVELCSKEKQLSEKQCNLEEYEKEILEVESLLNQRQAICDRRQKALVNLDEELQLLRQELVQTRDHIHKDGSIPESNTERARKNWDMVRRNLLDRQHLLETTVQKYRSELAAATSTIAGKDILIARLQNTMVDAEEEMANKDKRIKQLETKLGMALTEARTLTEQLSAYSHRELMSSANLNSSGEFGNSHLTPRRSSQELTPDQSRTSFRGSLYRRPSTFAGSDHADDHPKPVITPALDHDSEQFRNNARLLGKRSSISDNAITRLTLSTLKTDDKYGRGSSACSVQ